MLQIKNICKTYVTGDLTQEALNSVSFNLRESEFVAVLGQSGSGKTTLLNIIGGLDRYDSGDIVINNVSTKRYTDRDWDSYRNHTIGFVFQSYNLIPHQSILSNVELALTISGIPKSERKARASAALEEVGLGDQLHKRPNQMSGGQMQRVAIARALVNDPDILLADEPTGALDSETSVQVMELLKEVAKDRLVILVTHNKELADEYATRIIRLHDGKIVDDSNPYELDEAQLAEPKHKNMGKASMSFLTALSLSFNNLRTKKGRTILTAFAGSIGIIGIALILSLSNGVNTYIEDIQKDTMASYPIAIEAQSFDLSSIISSSGGSGMMGFDSEPEHELDGVYSNPSGLKMASSAVTSIKKNNLTEFKKYLDDPDNEIHQYIGENGIVYSYDVSFSAYSNDPDGVLVNSDGSDFEETGGTSRMADRMSSMMGGGMLGSSGNFSELLPGSGDNLISVAITDNYEVLHGSWPKSYDEAVLVLDANNEISATALYELGLLPSSEYKTILEKLSEGEEQNFDTEKLSYEDICKQTFKIIPASDFYIENEQGLFDNVAQNKDELAKLLEDALELKLVGVVRPTDDSSYSSVSSGVGYTIALTDYIINHTDDSAVVAAQEASADVSVLNGMTFEPKDDATKIADTKEYMSSLNVSAKSELFKSMMAGASAGSPENLERIMAMGEVETAAMLDQYLNDPEDESMLMIYETYISPGSYEDNLTDFGVVSRDAPSSISIYSDSFEDKDLISACISDYNSTASEENQITYTDFVGLLMSSVTTIVNVISYVLIAFVAVSLVVSSIMIGIITYISVLERTKEIGILRAIGASKGNISQVFNAETFIVGLIAGLFGVGLTLLLLIPCNAIIHAAAGTTSVNAALPAVSAVVLVLLSMGLTLLAGLIPSKKAAKKDPVEALRTE